MAAKISYFSVGCGDMTLMTFHSGYRLLTDCNIRKAACDPDDDTPDVVAQLRARLKRDYLGRPFVHAMLLSHPDEDHCRGLAEHFHLGPISDYPTGSDKIIINEMWSSPIVFRRADRRTGHNLCEDAKAWAKEARRRVALYKSQFYLNSGDRIRILGEDEGGKTDNLGPILTKIDEVLSTIDGFYDSTFEARLLAPMPKGDDAEEETLSKNNSSVIFQFTLKTPYSNDACKILSGGDADVGIWERMWAKHKSDASVLAYDILLTPHHCSWHCLSWDSWSELGEKVTVSQDARSALAQARSGAKLVASSKTITDDDSDPPCIRAEREYKAIAKTAKGEFVCIADIGDGPLEYEVNDFGGGVSKLVAKAAVVGAGLSQIGAAPIPHG